MRIRLTARWLLAVLTALAVPCLGHGEGLSSLRFEQYIESLRQQAGIPGLSAAIVQNGTIAWEKGFGAADVDRNIVATPDTPYPIGGLTAMFSAVQVLQCAERGQITLDTKVIDFYPAFGDSLSSVADVLTHTVAGKFAFDPNRYDAIAIGIKACSGKTLRAALSDEVLDRLSMMQSVPGHDFATWSPGTVAQYSPATIDRYASVMAQVAKAYRANPKGKPSLVAFQPTTGLRGASGIVASAHDLARFQAALDTSELLSADTLRGAWTPPLLTDGRPSVHAYGWFAQTYEGQPIVWQFGTESDGYSALVITIPQRAVTMILLANSDGLVKPFSLANGDISSSPFARLFLGLF